MIVLLDNMLLLRLKIVAYIRHENYGNLASHKYYNPQAFQYPTEGSYYICDTSNFKFIS